MICLRLITCVLLFVSAAAGQQMYQFGVDQDALAGAPDFSFLNQEIGPAQRVFAKNGQFFQVGPDLTAHTGDDVRIRFFGVNLVFGAAFPADADAERIAIRLRKLGVNLVRLHHLDTQPDRTPSNAGSLLTDGPYPTLNQVAVARMQIFVDALRKQGIYINFNLHVGYLFRPAVDGIPCLEQFPKQTKPLRLFYPAMVEKQLRYTSEVLDALSLKDDPALAMIEISNETSLVYHWQTASLDTYLQGEYHDQFAGIWNEALTRKYLTTEALRVAWGITEPDGSDVLPGEWRIESRGTPVALQRQGDELRIDSPQADTPVIIKQVGFSVEAGRPYIAELEMRAELPASTTRNIYWDVKQDVSPWKTVTGQTVQVTSEWRRYRMNVTPQFPMDNIGRFALAVEKVGAPILVRGWRLYAGGKRGLNEGESLESRNVAVVAAADIGTEARTNDYLEFLTEQDRLYLNTMLAAIREKTDALVPVAGTQMGFGGLLNIDSHRNLDYQDNHYYVDHYNFPNVSWDGRDWRMRDQSNVASGASAFSNMAIARQAGKPYTVSEFNQPWPNTYAAECDPTLAVFARFQDWDGVMHFAYSHGRGWDDGVPNGFNLNGDWTKWVSFGQSAWLFRSGAIREGLEPVEIPVSRDMRVRAAREKRNGSIGAFLASTYGYDAATTFVHPVRLAPDADAPVPEQAQVKRENVLEADTGEFTYDRERKLWLIHAEQAAGIFGTVGETPVKTGAIEVRLGSGARGPVSLLMNSLDGRALGVSRRILITIPGYSLRTQPQSTPARPQQLVRYGNTTDWFTIEPEPQQASKPSGNLNGGSAPTWMERIEMHVTLQTSASALRVYPLDGRGGRMTPLDAQFVEPVSGGFRIWLQADGQQFAPWYELEAEQ